MRLLLVSTYELGHQPLHLAAPAAALRAAGHEVRTVPLDVRSTADAEAAAGMLNRDGAVDILFANAGINWPDTPAEELDDEGWHRMIDINLSGVIRCCRAFGRPMLRRGRGAIVATGSMSGIISNRPQRQVHYNAAKAGLHHLVRSLAGEWALRGVRVNAVAPGYIDTAMSGPALRDPAWADIWLPATPMGRGGTAEEIAAVVLFLASDAASFVTGEVVVADGGYCAW